MQKNVELASDMGLLKIPHNTLVELGESRSLYPDEIVYLVTGSQGESRAALWNMATSSFKGLEIEKGDTVILSARIIPGNDRAISRLIGQIYKRGGNIIEEKRRLIHVSGHASQEDIKIMTETVQPKFVVPIHGEYRMLFRHREYIKNHIPGYTDENVILIENGDVFEVEKDRARVVEKNDVGKIFIDETASGIIDYEIVRERKKLAGNGLITLVVAIDKETKKIKSAPQITVQGMAGIDPLNGFLQDARDTISDAVAGMKREDFTDKNFAKETLRVHLKRFTQQETGSKPVIISSIVEV
jgi:ribonuclease J